MTESVISSPALEGELVENDNFPKGNIDTLDYPKGILEELTIEYDLTKPYYNVDKFWGPTHNRYWQVKCTVEDKRHNNKITMIGKEMRRIRDAEHSAAKAVLKTLDSIYYFSEQETAEKAHRIIYSMSQQNPKKMKVKLFKWTNSCEFCYARGHLKEECYGVLRNKNFKKPSNDNIDDFWDLPGKPV